ncbi:threonine ammonia-lyase [Natronococcus jeotgali]|uniref:threonine ammonia-lyase n=1 Tax=Natronococcus jeotgali DSM 18795 TaxID=1227498 RepID=L9XYD9_9EURY|nr:threonine ammonia-lyase [Natronococcus jeotgali]ELY65603.1 threonine dehydratase [Natronococcus jeotgali DSM 18795]
MLQLSDILEAKERVRDTSRWTPLQYSHTYSSITGADVHLKLENSQRTGAFKIRGATNRIATLSPSEREAGVVTASAGNHAQGVALAATRAGVDAKIVMPEHAPISKVKATRNYGAEVVLEGVDYSEAAERAHELEREEDRTYLHAFDDEDVMAGQGTIGLEILEDCPDVDTVVVPIGGGGLVSGIATAIKERKPDARVIGVQAEGASSAAPSLEKGERVTIEGVETIADGIATRSLGERTFPIVREYVDEVVTVSDPEIAVATIYLLERSKTVVEGAGAVPLAALLFDRFDYEPDETIVPVLSGGNIDLNTLSNVIVRGLVETGRYLKIRTVLKDRPGSLEELLAILTAHQANIYAIHHDRTSRDVEMSDTEVELELEMRGTDHVQRFLAALRDEGYEVDVLA